MHTASINLLPAGANVPIPDGSDVPIPDGSVCSPAMALPASRFTQCCIPRDPIQKEEIQDALSKEDEVDSNVEQFAKAAESAGKNLDRSMSLRALEVIFTSFECYC